MRPFRPALFLLACFLVQSIHPLAVSSEVGAPLLAMPIGVRSYGMGETGVADDADPSNLFFNPANLATLRGVHFTGSFGNLVPDFASDWWIGNAGVSGGYQTTLSNSTEVGFGGDVRFGRVDYGEWVATNPEGDRIGGFNPYENYVGVSAAGGVVFSDLFRVAAGATFKYWWADLAPARVTVESLDGTGNTVAFDMGLRVAAKLFEGSGFSFVPAAGISYVNVGPGIEFIDEEQKADLPRALRFGVSGRFESSSLPEIDDIFGTKLPIVCLSANLDVNDTQVTERSNIYGTGLEVALFKIVFARFGYTHDEDGDIKGPTYGVGLGLTFKMLQGRLDFARVPEASGLADVNKYGVSFGVSF